MRTRAAWLLSVSVGLVFLSPLLWMLAASLRPSSAVFRADWPALTEWSGLANYVVAWRRASLGQALALTLTQVLVIGAGGLLVNSLAAFAFARLRFRGREWLFAAVVALVILPVEVLAVPLLLTVRSFGLTGDYFSTLGGLTLPFVAKAFNIYFLRQHFLLVPRELEEAAALDGASVWDQFWSIALPSVRPALSTVLLLDLLTHWSDFLWPLLLATRGETQTLQIGLANLFTQPPLDWGAIMACAVLATLPMVVLIPLLQSSFVAMTGADRLARRE